MGACAPTVPGRQSRHRRSPVPDQRADARRAIQRRVCVSSKFGVSLCRAGARIDVQSPRGSRIALDRPVQRSITDACCTPNGANQPERSSATSRAKRSRDIRARRGGRRFFRAKRTGRNESNEPNERTGRTGRTKRAERNEPNETKEPSELTRHRHNILRLIQQPSPHRSDVRVRVARPCPRDVEPVPRQRRAEGLA